MTTPLASVVIPAHNEQRVLGRCLAALADHELDVVVVANACTDGTADVARAAGVRVIETATPGKAHAMNLGDAECAVFPRLYLDADIELTSAGVRDLVKALSADGVLAAAPTPRTDFSGVSWPVRRFQSVLDRLLGDRVDGLSGAGAYLLSEQAHDRVFPMPVDVIADEAHLLRWFAGEERVAVAAVTVAVRPPRSVAALVRRRARVRLGNQQLAARGLSGSEAPLRLNRLVRLVRAGDVPPLDAGCFLAILLADRLTALARRMLRRETAWSQDRTTRS